MNFCNTPIFDAILK